MSAPVRRNSPNFNQRDPKAPLRYVVLHYTGMKSGAEALARLTDPKSEVSAHYLIEEDGRVFQLVDEEKRAWHAGKSFWRGITDLNSASIGIEIVNPGHEFGYRAFPAMQIKALKELLRDIVTRRKLPADALLAHSDIAPGRKEDPGELFPWQDLAADGLGLWPAPQSADYAPAAEGEAEDMLRALGYDCPASGGSDIAVRAAILAFQRRFDPRNLTGNPEKETVACMRSLLRMKQ